MDGEGDPLDQAGRNVHAPTAHVHVLEPLVILHPWGDFSCGKRRGGEGSNHG